MLLNTWKGKKPKNGKENIPMKLYGKKLTTMALVSLMSLNFLPGTGFAEDSAEGDYPGEEIAAEEVWETPETEETAADGEIPEEKAQGCGESGCDAAGTASDEPEIPEAVPVYIEPEAADACGNEPGEGGSVEAPAGEPVTEGPVGQTAEQPGEGAPGEAPAKESPEEPVGESGQENEREDEPVADMPLTEAAEALEASDDETSEELVSGGDLTDRCDIASPAYLSAEEVMTGAPTDQADITDYACRENADLAERPRAVREDPQQLPKESGVTKADGDAPEPKTNSFFAPASENSTGGFVTRMYQVVLGRNPDPQGYKDWVSALESGSKNAADIVSGFFFSDEYTGRGKDNTAIVTDFYHAMLNRTPDSGGLANWKNALDIGMSMQVLNHGFVESREFGEICAYYGIQPGSVALTNYRDLNYERSYFVFRLYNNCLGRAPDVGGYENWCGYLSGGGSGADCASGFFFSPEFRGRHYSNSEFVDALYRTIIGRAADAPGKASWVNALDYSSTREHALNGFLFSQEFSNQCQTAGINVGKAIPEPDKETPWQYNIRILELCNRHRAKNGLAPLTTNEDLWRDVAMVRAAELPALFSHTRPNDTYYNTAFEEAGLHYRRTGENIYGGSGGDYGTPEGAVAAWMNSPGHRANILSSFFGQLATGYCYKADSQYRNYFCQNFGTP